MTRIRFDGWQPGFDKIAQARLLGQHAGIGLREAKGVVDRILSGETVIISMRSHNDATTLVQPSAAVGTQCTLVAESPTPSPHCNG